MKIKKIAKYTISRILLGMLALETASVVVGCGKVGGSVAKQVWGMMSKNTRVIKSGVLIPAAKEVYRHSDWNSSKCSSCNGTGRWWDSWSNCYRPCAACGGDGQM